jgi:hypothetical protein
MRQIRTIFEGGWGIARLILVTGYPLCLVTKTGDCGFQNRRLSMETGQYPILAETVP